MCKQQTIHPSASEFLFKNFLVCSQKWLIMITIMIITQLPGLGWYSLLVWWYIGLEPPKKVSGFLQTPLVCVGEKGSASHLCHWAWLWVVNSLSGQVRSAVVLQTKESNKTVSIVHGKMEAMAQCYYIAFSRTLGSQKGFGLRVLLALCNWA